ncbi:MAG: hypothetical protein LJE92_15945 [Gammaproteobacteria bacterium]|jgi:hypothetical protein|nr:hypothetical protein [Gammaproteobacteria bacterium]
MYRDDELHPEDEKRREYLVRLLTLSAMTATPLSQVQAAWWGSTPEKLPEDKSIFSLEGDVRVNGQRADLGTRIQGGDRVSTQRDSEVVFAVGSDSFILRSNSEMEIEGGGFFIDTLRMLTGSVLSVFGRRSAQQQLMMNSSTATIGIRGTGVYMESEPGLTYLCTCYGQVGLYASDDLDDSQLITATHHDAPKYISDRKIRGTSIRPAPFKNHTDAELKILEAIVGRAVPFGIESELYKGERREY